MEARGRSYHGRAVFAAQRLPWRLTQISLRSCDDKDLTAVVSWADDATALLRGSPAQLHIFGPNESTESTLRPMLEPDALEAVVPKPWPTEFRVPGAALDDTYVVPAFVSLASDHYEVRYHEALDVLTRWAAIIDNEVAREIALSHLSEVSRRGTDPPA